MCVRPHQGLRTQITPLATLPLHKKNLFCRFARPSARTAAGLKAEAMAPRRVLAVAEKPSVAKEIANILSQGTCRSREGAAKYNRLFEFSVPYNGSQCQMTVTSARPATRQPAPGPGPPARTRTLLEPSVSASVSPALGRAGGGDGPGQGVLCRPHSRSRMIDPMRPDSAIPTHPAPAPAIEGD